MSITAKNETVQEEGQDKEALTITFTNGAKEQLEQLTSYFRQQEPLEVVRLAIAFLQKIKEAEEKKTQEKNGRTRE